MSVASEFPPEVYIPAAARARRLRVAGDVDPMASPTLLVGPPVGRPELVSPVASAAAAFGAEVVDLDRWRHQFVGAQVGGRRRIVADLRTRPDDFVASAPVRLTRRGLIVLLAASALIAVAIVVIAWLSAGTGSAGATNVAAPRVAGGDSSVVTVQAGDSLWTIATRVAPNRDPRSEIADLQKLNHLAGDAVTPGQQLRVQ